MDFFARAVCDENPVYHDPEAAKAAGFNNVVAPPTFTFALNHMGRAGETQPPDPTGGQSPFGALVGGLKRLREAGGSLALVISTPRILRILQITGLTKALAAQRSVADAITADPHWQHTAESEAGSVHEWCRRYGLS